MRATDTTAASHDGALLKTDAVAAMLGVSADFVRTHAADLGAARIGNSKTGPLRFRRGAIDAYVNSRRLDPTTPTPRLRRKPGPRRGGVKLLPLPDDRCER